MVNELKQILKKDFNKKMVENTAFKLFEVWWEQRKKSEKSITVPGAIPSSITNNVIPAAAVTANDAPTAVATVATVAPTAAIPTAVKDEAKNQGLASLLDQASTPLGLNYDGLGLGFRASMPKMPSFMVSVCKKSSQCCQKIRSTLNMRICIA